MGGYLIRISLPQGGLRPQVALSSDVVLVEQSDGTYNIEQELKIESEPTDITAVAGNEVTLEVEAVGSGEITYQWYKNDTSDTTTGLAIEGATSSSYKFIADTGDNGTYYYCVIKQDRDGTMNTETTTPIKLSVESSNYSITKENITTYYSSLALAIADAEENDTIVTLQSVTDSSTAIVDKNLTLDTSSYTITTANTITVNDGYSLNLTGNGTITSSSATTITNKGILTLDEGVAVANTNASLYGINNTGTVTMENGEISTSGYGIYNTGTANLNGGSVTASTVGRHGIYNYQNGAVNIAGATVSSTNYYGIYNYSTSESYTPTVTMSSGTISGTYGIYNYGSGSTYSAVVKVTGGTITRECVWNM